MNGCGIGRSKTRKGERGHSAVCKGCGVAGINVLTRADAKAKLRAHIFDVSAKRFLGTAAGNKLAHYTANHIKIDIKHYLFKLVLVISHVGLGAEKSALLTTTANETNGILGCVLYKIFRNTDNADGSRHIIVRALRKRCGIVVSGENDDLVALALDIRNNVVRNTLALGLLYAYLSVLCALFDKSNGFFSIYVHAEKLFCVCAHIRAKLTRVDILVCVIEISVVGDKADSAVIHDIVIDPMTHIAVYHNYLSPTKRKRIFIGRSEIVKRCFYFSRATAKITLALNALAVNGESGALNFCNVYLKLFKMRAHTELFALSFKVFGTAQLLVASANASVRRFIYNSFYVLSIHSFTLFVFFL